MNKDLREDLVKIALTDLLLYRTEKESGLLKIQEKKWGKVLYLLKDCYGLDFYVSRGIMPVIQSEKTKEKLYQIVNNVKDDEIIVLWQIARLLGSTLLALAVYEKLITPKDAFEYSVVDEVWQNEISGYDEEETARRENMQNDFYEIIKGLNNDE